MSFIRKYSPVLMNRQTVTMRSVEDLYYGKILLSRLHEAVLGTDEITVYGDYDADGIMAVYILYSGLSHVAPGRINWFINNRHVDGYNISTDSMKKCLEKYPNTKTLITCDNGINAAEAVDYAMYRGICVLVTDHHIQTTSLRPDCPAIDEKSIMQMERDHAAGIMPEEFCGAELARRVIEALYEEMNIIHAHEGFLQGLYAYSGLATITDHVPMNASNHHVGRKGLQIIQKNEGIWGILKDEFINNTRETHWDTIGFYYGPLINADSRMTGDATHAMNMLLASDAGDETACREAVRELVALNIARRELCAQNDEMAFRIIEEQNQTGAPFILVWDERFSEGVNGLTATHITEQYGVPSAVLSPTRNDPDMYKGSARSVNGVNLIELLQAHTDFIQSGGHAMAAGLSVHRKDLGTVRRLLCEDLAGFVAPDEPPADFSYHSRDLTMDIAVFHERFINENEPFGPGFEEPRIDIRGPVNNLWSKKKKDSGELVHAQFPMGKSRDGYYINANWWNHLKEAEMWYKKGKELNCRGKVERNSYVDKNGVERTSIQITIDKLIETGTAATATEANA